MKSIIEAIDSLVGQSYVAALDSEYIQGSVELIANDHGDFASNIALKKSAELKVSPFEIADKVAIELEKKPEIDSATAHPAGFINIRVSKVYLLYFLQLFLENPSKYINKPLAGTRLVMDYSHPNIGKPMGVHHLLSTVIGDSIKRLHRVLGQEVIADNFVGDMGTQFGKLIHAVKTWGDPVVIDADPIAELLKLYVKFHISAESDTELDEKARAEYLLLEQGDPENRELHRKIVSWSKAEMQAIYDTLGVEFDHMNGESFYEDKMQPIIDLGIEKGLFVRSEGALVCFLEDETMPPAIIQKKDGASLYLTRDLARIAYWEHTWHPDEMMVVVDIAQSFEQKQLYEVARKLKITDSELVHVAFGRMQFKDGSMSTRKGNIVLVEQVIDETRERVKNQIVSLSKGLSTQEQGDLCEVLAINALKYNVLRQNRLSNIVFDWNQLLTLEGNSAPYLCYSLVRALSVEKKLSSTIKPEQEEELSTKEKELLLYILQCKQVFKRAAEENMPSTIASYCYNIAKSYNAFYNSSQIVGGPEHRLFLNTACVEILSQCFSVLGLVRPNKM